MSDCIFCKIIKGEIPSEKVYEDDHTLAFLDIHPNSKGHSLVIPKEHHPDLLQTPETVRNNLTNALVKTSEIIKKKYAPTGMNITSNIGRSAGQVVFHTHIHIIPRYEK